ncbi:MAG: flagellar assembly protein [Beijerinckiaceae bacterium]|nr:MAG: flagellar assembly protein [Beijerinckiaceae bacterium]
MAGERNAFNFGRDFTKSGHSSPFIEPGARVPVPFVEHARLLAEAKADSFNAGVEEGRRLQRDDESIRLSACLEALGARLEIATIEMRRLEDNARKEALAFAQIFARKIAGRMIENAPLQAIEATARAIFTDLRGTPHVAVRVAPSLVDSCKTRISLLMRENGIEAKLFVFPDPDIATGDCRIEWADGGVVREQAKLEALIDRSVTLLFPDRE